MEGLLGQTGDTTGSPDVGRSDNRRSRGHRWPTQQSTTAVFDYLDQHPIDFDNSIGGGARNGISIFTPDLKIHDLAGFLASNYEVHWNGDVNYVAQPDKSLVYLLGDDRAAVIAMYNRTHGLYRICPACLSFYMIRLAHATVLLRRMSAEEPSSVRDTVVGEMEDWAVSFLHGLCSKYCIQRAMAGRETPVGL